jgi:hypothetical protein
MQDSFGRRDRDARMSQAAAVLSIGAAARGRPERVDAPEAIGLPADISPLGRVEPVPLAEASAPLPVDLVRAGDRSVPLVTAAILDGATGHELPDVLASIGTDRARAALVTLVREAPEVRAAATEALATLDAIRDLDR